MITSKLPNVGTNIFSVMSQMALDHQAVNLGQGFPDYEPAAALRDAVTEAMNTGFNQYPPMAGIAPLRAAIKEKVMRLYKRDYDANTEITVTSGATEALMAAILAIAGKGDEVIIIEPSYDAYSPAISLAGATPVFVAMRAPSESDPYYRIDWDKVRASITPNTRAIIVNSPHNPTGSVMSESDLDALEAIVADTRILIISDEAYEHIVFDGAKHLSIAGRPALSDRAFVVFTFGKTYHITGWKVGYCCAPKALTEELRKIHQFLVFTVPTPLQVALAHYMQDEATYTGLSQFYEEKRDWLTSELKKTRLQPLPSAGTFFLLANYQDISDLPEIEFAKWLTVEHGVTTIPVSSLYHEPEAAESNHHLVRLCFGKRQETLQSAIDKLHKL